MILAGETLSLVQESLTTWTSFKRGTILVRFCLARLTSRWYIAIMEFHPKTP